MTLRFEAWTLPWSATFERVVADIPAVAGSGTVTFNDMRDASIDVPSDWDRLSDVISTTTGTLIRVYDGSTIIQEFLAERVASNVDDDGTVTISGPDVAAAFERVVVYPYDYPTNPSAEQDWQWGSGRELVSNTSFEGGTNLVENPGFESGETDPWWAGAVDGVSATLVIESTTIDTGSFSAKCTALLQEGGMSVNVTGLVPAKTYTVTARVRAPSSETMNIGCDGPVSVLNVTGDRVLFIDANPQGYEVQKDFTGTGAFQTVTFQFTAGVDQTYTQLSIRDTMATPTGAFYVDLVTVTGYGAGMSPWQPSNTTAVTVFEASTDVTAHAGTYTGKVTATDGNGIHLNIDGVDEGVTHTVSVRLRNTTGSARWAVELRDQLGSRLGQGSVATSTTFQQVTFTVVVPADLPGNRRQLQLWIYNVSGATATVYVDSVSLIPGQAAATVGTIVTQLMDDAAVDHASDPRGVLLDWVDYTGFTATVDSDGTSWAQPISFTAYRGATYIQTFDRLIDQNFEWRLTPKATPSGGLTHDLEWYEPDGLGTLLNAANSPTLTVGQSTLSGPIVNRIPAYTAVLVEGAAGAWVEDTDATAVTNFGRAERYKGDRGLADATSRGFAADALLALEASNRAAVAVTVAASDDHARPLVDYKPGDSMYFQFPPNLAKQVRRVQQVVWRHGDTATYTVTGSRVLVGETAAFEGLRRLLRRFSPLDRPDVRAEPPVVEVGGGGKIPYLVAANAAPQAIKDIAGYVCDGTNDHVELQEACDTYTYVLLSEGTFNITANTLDIGFDKHLQGAGRLSTTIQVTSGSANQFALEAGFDCVISDLAIQNSAGVNLRGIVDNGSASNVVVQNVWFQTLNVAVEVGGDNWIVTGCECSSVTTFVDAPSPYCDNVLIYGNHQTEAITAGQSDYWTIVGNNMKGAITASTSVGHSIIGNHWDTPTSADPAISLTSVTGFHIASNHLENFGVAKFVSITNGGDGAVVGNVCDEILTHAVRVDGASRVVVADNRFETEEDGIILDDASDCHVADNYIDMRTANTTNTFDGIRLEGNSDRNFITANRVLPDATTKPRYGINVSVSTCDNNRYVGNMCYPSADFGTAAYNDAGTGTVNTWPAAGGAQGDNFQ